jgi:uncharacterized membrane protein YedE/YeeE
MFGFEAEILIIYAFVILAVILTVMSLLLPFLVLRICKEIMQMNKRLETLIDTLNRIKF